MNKEDSKQINLHYVPQVYLKSFRSRNKGNEYYIWCYDKLEKRSFQPNIRNVAAKRFFYRIPDGVLVDDLAVIGSAKCMDVETFFSNMEAKFPIIRDSFIKSIINGTRLDQNHVEFLVDYIYFQLQRTYDLQEMIWDFEFNRKLIELEEEHQMEVGQGESINNKFFEIAHRSAAIIAGNVEIRVMMMFDKDSYHKIRDRLYSMSWNFAIAGEGEGFVTSDNPVLKLCSNKSRPQGVPIEDPDSKIYFVLSPRYALVLGVPNRGSRSVVEVVNVVRPTQDVVTHYNKLHVIRANRYVFPVQMSPIFAMTF